MIELVVLGSGLTPDGTGPDAERLTPARLAAVLRSRTSPGTLWRRPASLQYVGMTLGPARRSQENRNEA